MAAAGAAYGWQKPGVIASVITQDASLSRHTSSMPRINDGNIA
jgi:hypothetical protein